MLLEMVEILDSLADMDFLPLEVILLLPLVIVQTQLVVEHSLSVVGVHIIAETRREVLLLYAVASLMEQVLVVLPV